MRSIAQFLNESIKAHNPLTKKQFDALCHYIGELVSDDTLKKIRSDYDDHGSSLYEGELLNTIEEFCVRHRIDFDSVLGWYSLEDIIDKNYR